MPAPVPIKKSISDIKSLLGRPALTSHFQCWFNPPGEVRDWINNNRKHAGLGDNYTDSNADFYSLSCSETSLPGSSLMTNEIVDDYTGVTERHAYRRQYDDRVDFTFYVDHDYNIISFFENWMAYIVNEQYNTENQNGVESSQYFYRMNFPEIDEPNKRYSEHGYKTTVFLKKFERDVQGRVLQYRFLNAYPISITSMPISYESSQLLKCTVSFTYSRYIVGGGETIKPQQNIPNAPFPPTLNGVPVDQNTGRSLVSTPPPPPTPPSPPQT